MIMAAITPEQKMGAYIYLRMMGAHLQMSEDFQAIVNVSSEELKGVVGFNGFLGKTAQVHIAGTGNWVTREFIRQVFDYAFNQLKLNYLIGVVNSDNARALRFDQRMGFKLWQTLPNGVADGVDLVILKMNRDECKWLNGKGTL